MRGFLARQTRRGNTDANTSSCRASAAAVCPRPPRAPGLPRPGAWHEINLHLFFHNGEEEMIEVCNKNKDGDILHEDHLEDPDHGNVGKELRISSSSSHLLYNDSSPTPTRPKSMKSASSTSSQTTQSSPTGSASELTLDIFGRGGETHDAVLQILRDNGEAAPGSGVDIFKENRAEDKITDSITSDSLFQFADSSGEMFLDFVFQSRGPGELGPLGSGGFNYKYMSGCLRFDVPGRRRQLAGEKDAGTGS
eukprot:g2696.t1